MVLDGDVRIITQGKSILYIKAQIRGNKKIMMMVIRSIICYQEWR